MKRRKGWHRPRRNKMPMRYPVQVANRALARAGLPQVWADADREVNPLLATLMSREELLKMYPNKKR